MDNLPLIKKLHRSQRIGKNPIHHRLNKNGWADNFIRLSRPQPLAKLRSIGFYLFSLKYFAFDSSANAPLVKVNHVYFIFLLGLEKPISKVGLIYFFKEIISRLRPNPELLPI